MSRIDDAEGTVPGGTWTVVVADDHPIIRRRSPGC